MRADDDVAATGNLADLLWSAAAHGETGPAIIDGKVVTSFGELCAQAAAAARLLREEGLSTGDRVAILMDRGAVAAATYFGALAAGAVVTIINDRLRPHQIEHVLRQSGASLLVISPALAARQPRAIESSTRQLLLDSLTPGSEFVPVRRENDLAQLIYTSGSTGLPKGVMFSHRTLLDAVAIVRGYLGLTSEDRTASLLSFSSVYGLNQMLCSFASRGTLVLSHSPVPSQIVTDLRELGATVAAAVPPLWMQLLGVPSFANTPLPSLRIAQNAGGHLPVDAVLRLRRAQPQARLFLQYGMTETFRGSFLPPEEVDDTPDSMGRAIPGVEIDVVREDGTSCDVGEVGELVHSGVTLSAGYWNDAPATGRTFREHPRASGRRAVFSGDLVRRDERGLLYYVGRRDRMIKTLGFRVGPDEILDVLFASRQIDEGVVVGEADRQRGERIVAYVVLAPAGDLEKLQAFARSELPRHMQPARIEARRALPRLGSGKYDLQELLGPPSYSPPAPDERISRA
jgi:acyl-CoA synthetase (AMP-forming)/AMP-acid ligase II